MADELKLQATVVDNFSNPLKALREALNQLGQNPAGKALAKEWGAVNTTMRQLADGLRTQLTPAFSGLNIMSLSAGGALATLAAGTKAFANTTEQVRLFGREIGMTGDQLRTWSAIGERFGVSAGSMKSGLMGFSDELKRMRDGLSDALPKLRFKNMDDLADDLVNSKNLDEAMKAVAKKIGALQSPFERRNVLRIIGLPEDLSAIFAEIGHDIEKELKETQARIGTVGPAAQKASSDFNKAFASMSQSIEGMRNNSLGPLLTDLNEVGKTFSSKGWLEGLSALDRALDKALPGPNLSIENLLGRTSPAVREAEKRKAQVEREFRNADTSIAEIEARGGDASSARRRSDELKRELEKLTDELKRLREGDGATAQKSAFGGVGGFNSLIQSASFGALSGGFGGGYGRNGVGPLGRVCRECPAYRACPCLGPAH